MMTNINAIKTQLEAIVSPEVFDFETNEDFAQSYREQRKSFLLNRIKLQPKLMMIIGLTLTAFFMWVNEGIPQKISAFKIGLLVEFYNFKIGFLVIEFQFEEISSVGKSRHIHFSGIGINFTLI